MLAQPSYGVRSRPAHPRRFHLEQLETRRLLSVSLLASFGLDDPGDNMAMAKQGLEWLFAITPAAAKLPKIEGTYHGKFVSNVSGEHPLLIVISHFTHTGHFTGVVTFTNSAGKFPADLKGVIHNNHHLDISFEGTDFSGTMTGVASHTGGSFSGDYTVVGGAGSHGTFRVAKT